MAKTKVAKLAAKLPAKVSAKLSSPAPPPARRTKLRIVTPADERSRKRPPRSRKREEPLAPRPEPAPEPRAPKRATEFYERLGRDVVRVFGKTVRQVLAAGLPGDEVVPAVFGKFSRAFGGLPGRIQDRLGALGLGDASEFLDPDTWRGLSMLVSSSLQMKIEAVKRRRAGDYEVDAFGLDEDYLARVRPLFRFLYKKWWNVKVTGLSNVPSQGRALLVSNHSGVLPYDGAMIATAIWEEHENPRLLRALHLEWFVGIPFVAPLLQKTGQVMANPDNGERLLQADHLVTVFPEGLKGVGKLFKNRYHLARFGRGGFIKMAIRARAPIIPVSVVGAEEIHPVLLQMDVLAKPFGFPFLPLTPTFPHLGPLGLIPLPSNWRIHFGEPIDMSVHSPDDANDFHLVSQLSDHVRTVIQRNIHDLLKQRPSAFGR